MPGSSLAVGPRFPQPARVTNERDEGEKWHSNKVGRKRDAIERFEEVDTEWVEEAADLTPSRP